MLRALWGAVATLVPLVVVANVAVELTPHVRGIGFALPLRYVNVLPACAAAAVAAAFLYAQLDGQVESPRWTFAVVVASAALVVLGALALVGSIGLLRAAWPAVFASALTLAWLVPRAVDRAPGAIGVIALVLFGGLELLGFVAARASERRVPEGPSGMAFDVPRALFDVDHAFAELPTGGRVHYVDEGTGPTLLFLHGNPAWSFQWRDLIAGLRGHFRCVAIDYPGFGLSPGRAGFGYTPGEQSRVVEELVDHLGLRDVTLVMQDWGGPIGLGLAGRRPDLVRRVVLGNTWAWPTSTAEDRGKFSVLVGGPIGEFAQVNFNGFASFGLQHGVMHELPPAVLDTYLRPFQRLEGRGIAAFYPGQITADAAYMAEVEAGLAKLGGVEALIFWGMRDRGFPRPDLARFESAFPHHRTIELADADHFFFEDAAPRMIEEITAFAGSLR